MEKRCEEAGERSKGSQLALARATTLGVRERRAGKTLGWRYMSRAQVPGAARVVEMKLSLTMKERGWQQKIIAAQISKPSLGSLASESWLTLIRNAYVSQISQAM
jgi:hypothetical protein